MGFRRPRYLIFGLLVLVAVVWSQGTSGSQPVRADVVRSDVTAAGRPTDGPGWKVGHPTTGVYRIEVPGSAGALDVVAWRAPADVMIVPLGGDRAEVRFVADGEPIDTDFEVVAARSR